MSKVIKQLLTGQRFVKLLNDYEIYALAVSFGCYIALCCLVFSR